MDITPLHRYYGPIRLPSEHPRPVIDSQRDLPQQAALGVGLPKFVSCSFERALSPTTPTSLASAFNRFYLAGYGFTTFGKLATGGFSVTRP